MRFLAHRQVKMIRFYLLIGDCSSVIDCQQVAPIRVGVGFFIWQVLIYVYLGIIRRFFENIFLTPKADSNELALGLLFNNINLFHAQQKYSTPLLPQVSLRNKYALPLRRK